MKTNFELPKTPTCDVVWYRNGKKNVTTIETPANNDMLVHRMLMDHKVGFGEIRAVKAINTGELNAMDMMTNGWR